MSAKPDVAYFSAVSREVSVIRLTSGIREESQVRHKASNPSRVVFNTPGKIVENNKVSKLRTQFKVLNVNSRLANVHNAIILLFLHFFFYLQ